MTGSAIPNSPRWRKASYSAEANCVEMAQLPDGSIGLRHSQVPSEEIVVFTPAEIEAFFAGVKAGEFDDLIS